LRAVTLLPPPSVLITARPRRSTRNTLCLTLAAAKSSYSGPIDSLGPMKK
jgi:hypothetical protein